MTGATASPLSNRINHPTSQCAQRTPQNVIKRALPTKAVAHHSGVRQRFGITLNAFRVEPVIALGPMASNGTISLKGCI